MSNNNNANTEVTSKFLIVNKIARMLKLGDFGKIESFIERVEKLMNKEISSLEKNTSNAKFNSENRKDELKDQLEDAKSDLENAYLAIDPKAVDTNEKQKAFMEVYLDKLAAAEAAVEEIEEAIKAEDERLAKEIKENDEAILVRKARITSITGK